MVVFKKTKGFASVEEEEKAKKLEAEKIEKFLNNKEYIRANRPGLFSIKYPEEAAQDFMRSRKK